jgi:hypothetical protein
MAGMVDHMGEQMEALQTMFTQSDISNAQIDNRLGQLAGAIEQMTERLDRPDSSAALNRIAEGQERLIAVMEDGGADGMDAESRMRLRSIDVQMLRILEEISAGRQESMADLRTDIAGLSRAIRQSNKPGRGRNNGNGGGG